MKTKKRDISPEEKLLNLIKNKKQEPEPITEEILEKPAEIVPEKMVEMEPNRAFEQEPENKPSETIASKAEERISGILKSEIFHSKVFEPSRLKVVNRYLIIALSVLFLYFLIDIIFVRPYKNVQSIIAKAGSERAEKSSSAGTKNAAIIKDYSSYSNSVSGRSVFGKSQGAAAPGEDVTTADNLPDRIGLVGIIAGDNPQAIIEDKKVQKTYYLNKGQSFDGYIVEDILDDKVILDYEGKKISLFL